MIIGRPTINEIPWMTSPRVLALGNFSIPLSGGQFTITPSTIFSFSPSFTLMKESLYWFRNISVCANVPEEAFAGAITNPVMLTLLSSAKGYSPFLRDSIQIGQYLKGQELGVAYYDRAGNNELKANLSGTLAVTPALAGKPSINLFVAIDLIQITDFGFIEKFIVQYDRLPQGDIAKTSTVVTPGLTIRN